MAFTPGASFARLAGAFFAARQGLVTPESFTFVASALIFAAVVGGMGSQLGVVFAARLFGPPAAHSESYGLLSVP